MQSTSNKPRQASPNRRELFLVEQFCSTAAVVIIIVLPLEAWRMAEVKVNTDPAEVWPALPQAEWSDTCATLQLWMQIIGKIRLALMPHISHCWGSTLYPTVRGVTTAPMPCGAHTLQSVAVFYVQVMAALNDLGTPVHIWPVPVEVSQPIPFEQDETHCAYDPAYAQRFWRILLQATRVFTIFRARFVGKVSPIHLFWGALDLACTRFSGRVAPQHPGVPGLADRVTRDAYSHEVSSCGFWPGAPGVEPFFYSYAYPEPPGFRDSPLAPPEARFDATMGEFLLPYEAMRQSADPDAALLEFLQSTYEAAANCAHWDRAALEVTMKPNAS
jgi:hypothetical protein